MNMAGRYIVYRVSIGMDGMMDMGIRMDIGG